MNANCKSVKFNFLFCVCILLSTFSYGQLANFSLQVTATNETCTANGSLSFTALTTTPGAILVYQVFKAPDFVNPINVTGGNTFGGLTAGNYRVIATQSLGNLSNVQQQDVQINNLIIPVAFQIVSQPALFCGETGIITVNVSVGAPVTYEIISGPLVVAPQTSNVFSGLPPGEYVIRVNDACGDGVVQTHFLPIPPPNLTAVLSYDCDLLNCTTKKMDVVVYAINGTLIVYPLEVQLTVFMPDGTPIVFNQTVTSGSPNLQAVSFVIPYSATPINLVNLTVTDPCGNIKTVNNTAVLIEPSISLDSQPVTDCGKEIDISLCYLLPPYNVNFLTAPPGFIAANFNVNNLGPFYNNSIIYASTSQNELPVGNYTIEVTDSCGTRVQQSIVVTEGFTDHALQLYFVNCIQNYRVIIPNLGIPPVTVVLTTAPSGYDHTLPYDLSSNISNGSFSMDLPLMGTYTFTGINACGDPYIRIVEVLPPVPILEASGGVTICSVNGGTITVKLVSAPLMASVFIIQAPNGYNQPLPHDVSAYINAFNMCIIPGLPIGDYTLLVTDVCGTVYPPVTATVTAAEIPLPPTIEFLKGCGSGIGSMKMLAKEVRFLQIIIIAAPLSYNQTLPFDVSFNIDPLGEFYMNNLPEGTYTFYIKDVCNVEQNVTLIVPGNNVIQSDIVVIGNCGSFNLFLNHFVEQPYIQSFWLQKWNLQTSQWVHPITGVAYINGNPPTTLDSYRVYNYATNFNIASLGFFRIVKYNLFYSNGNPQFEFCNTVIKEFEFTGELQITSSSAIPCNNGTTDVFITAGGIPPFDFKITSKDGQPFFVNNGNSNIFAGLSPGIYNFQVEDLCGNIVNRLLDINTLSEPTISAQNFCEGQNGQLSVQAISFLNYQWWKGTDTSIILSTTNILSFNPISNLTTPGIYYVRIYSTSNLSCIDKIISFTVPPLVAANAGKDAVEIFCGGGQTIDLFSVLGAPFDANGVWQEMTTSGTLSGNVWSAAGVPFGIYVFQYTVNNFCGPNDQATVTIQFNAMPSTPIINVTASSCISDSIQFNLDSIPNATFQWTGPNGFYSSEQNPTIVNSSSINNGVYTVVATSNGCESTANVTLNLQPKPEFQIASSCINGNFTLAMAPIQNPTISEVAVYAWTGPAGFTSDNTTIQITGLSAGWYGLTVTNPDGCAINHSVLIGNTTCAIPNVITPNEDNENDVFDLTGLEVNRIEIYSRWGRLVYEQNNYTNQWHGQNKQNHQLPDATYYYILYLKTGANKQGWVFKTSQDK
ncbi:MAG: gliding motility-associated C-terminal domain-containing protein [Burkholderiales bacterium]|nr:gliding motility-associated C-terminal domain-containing protein [Flavobacterium sp.]